VAPNAGSDISVFSANAASVAEAKRMGHSHHAKKHSS